MPAQAIPAARPPADPTPPVLDGLRQIAEGYDLILCDVWGVLHDGIRGHRAAAEALIRFRALPPDGRPRRVVLVSNAPRPWEGVQRILDGFGVDRDAYDAILTSGDLTRGMIATVQAERGRDIPIHHLGPERDAGIFDGLGLSLVPATDCRLVVCTGLLDDDVETVEDYRARLADFRGRGVPMICANPDLVVERGGRLIPCAGLIAAAFAESGGVVTYAGKPHRPIYEEALAMAGRLDGREPPAKARVLALGDALRTDIAGADGFGLPNLLVARGIHAAELGLTADSGDLGGLADWLATKPVRPGAVIEHLTW
ncbi:TIGR01459 family HAD-type hydrolase [Methylobacterium sp. sgz302541]|uniref:TIGR01459 family HAD-type hydrolase n=1 Tax=unclassified Methylobacterium TaxID=2615210 RepID=UPI003D338D82